MVTSTSERSTHSQDRGIANVVSTTASMLASVGSIALETIAGDGATPNRAHAWTMVTPGSLESFISSYDAELEGAYRFFGNEAVTPEAILAPHFRQTARRASSLPQVILVENLHGICTCLLENLAPVGSVDHEQHAGVAVRAQVAERIGASVATVRRYEGTLLHPHGDKEAYVRRSLRFDRNE